MKKIIQGAETSTPSIGDVTMGSGPIRPDKFDVNHVHLDTYIAREVISAQAMNQFPPEQLPEMEHLHKEQLARTLGRALIKIASIKISDVKDNKRLGARIGTRTYEASLTLFREPEDHASAHERRLREDINLLRDLMPRVVDLEPLKSAWITSHDWTAYEAGYQKAVRDATAVVNTKANEINAMIPVKEEEML